MAKKFDARARTVRAQPSSPQQAFVQRRWRRKLVLGGVILVLVLGVGGVVRYMQQRHLTPRLQVVVDRHYTRGTAGAPVVVKEFSDYT